MVVSFSLLFFSIAYLYLIFFKMSEYIFDREKLVGILERAMMCMNKNMNHKYAILTDFNLGSNPALTEVCVIALTDFSAASEQK